ncbi:MAG: hypothetical protein R2710_07585 [Acidimicrobiales bacterium]
MTASLPLIPTTVMGSYPQPDWLIDHERLRGVGVPRVRASDVWNVDPGHLDEAVEAATLVAIHDQEDAGVDVITDGEVRRESYFNHFANLLGGVDPDVIGKGVNRRGGVAEVPLVNGPIVRTAPIELDAAEFLMKRSTAATKVTVPGPFTLSQLADNQYYPDQRTLALAYADAVNAELRDLAAAGVDVLQLDEPYLQANPESASAFAVEAISRAVAGIETTTTLHTCYGYAAYVSEKKGGYPFFAELAEIPVDFIAIETAQPDLDPHVIEQLAPRGVVLGVIDLGRETVETPDEVATRIRRALEVIAPEKLWVSPDCGMKYLPRARAKAKLQAMAEGAALVRAELA